MVKTISIIRTLLKDLLPKYTLTNYVFMIIKPTIDKRKPENLIRNLLQLADKVIEVSSYFYDVLLQ